VKNLLTLLGNDCGQNIDGCMESMSLDLHRDKNGPCAGPRQCKTHAKDAPRVLIQAANN
jgi:hypothetical protein